MNQDVLCLYYSRTGYTRQAMTEIAEALDCECVPVHDRVRRTGALGWLRCGLDSMRKRTRPLDIIRTSRDLFSYRLVIIGTPVWAGRCSSVIRGLLKRRGYEMRNVAYVITRKSEELHKDVYRQMDLYVQQEHVAAVSLRVGTTGYHFWRDQFIKSVSDYLASPHGLE